MNMEQRKVQWQNRIYTIVGPNVTPAQIRLLASICQDAFNQGVKEKSMSEQTNHEIDIELIGTYTARAGKEYSCTACGKVINKGERYTRISYKSEGQFLCHHYHYSCGV